MLTRIKITGFKNLMGVDVHFGPFTCIAGANGVGKSNLFDAIRFLSALADRPLIDAALVVRDEGGRTADIRSLFHRVGDEHAKELSFEVEMIVPQEGFDDLGQKAKAGITFLRYCLTLGLRMEDNLRPLGTLEILREELSHINIGDAPKYLFFPHGVRTWRKSALQGRRTSPLISTEGKGESRIIKRHQDGISGRPLSLLATNLPRTVLSVANAKESPTTLLARREMQSWRLLQLEPSALRKPNEFNAPARLGSDGSNLAATLYHLAHSNRSNGTKSQNTDLVVYGQVANRLAELIDDVYEVKVDRDEKRELLTLQVTDQDGTAYPAISLSDGTLRFLALAVLELDPQSQGLLCFEEPENGIHPERIPSMLQLLQDISTDTFRPISSDNPLRQVIVNTHSPSVVGQVPDDSLLVAELKDTVGTGRRFKRVCFSCLPDTWRAKIQNASIVSKGKLLSYLNPVLRSQTLSQKPQTHRVIDRPDLQPYLPGIGHDEK
jgi:predicted ATPase